MVAQHYRWDFIGLSTDQKPTPETSEKVTDGSTFYCSDNSKLYVFYKNQWYEKEVSGGGGPTVVQTTGTSTTDVMSQNATTSMIFSDPSAKMKPQIGAGASASGTDSVALGRNAKANAPESVSIGKAAGNGSSNINKSVNIGTSAGYQISESINGSISLGAYSKASRTGELNIGSTDTSYGYNSTNYRVIGGVHDPVDAHDAATKGYVDSKAGFFNIENIVQAAYENPDVQQPITLQEYEALEEACMDFLPLAYYHYDGSTYTFVIIPSYDCNPSSDIGVNVDTISYFMGKFSFQYNNGQPYVTFTQV